VTSLFLTNATSTLNNSVFDLNLINGSTVTTTAAGGVTGNVTMSSGSTINLGADTTLSGPFSAEGQGLTINMNGHALSAGSIDLGYNSSYGPTIENRGAITTQSLAIGNIAFNLIAGDHVTSFDLNSNATSTLYSSVSNLQLFNGSTATTTAAGSVTGTFSMSSGSTLNLGSAMNLSGNFYADDLGLTFNMNGYSLTASLVDFGYYNHHGPTIENPGAIIAGTLLIGNTTFNLSATASVTDLTLSNATSTLNSNVSNLQLATGSAATTTATGSVTGSVDVLSGSTLNLGASLSLSSYLNIQDGSMVDAHHFSITADSISIGYSGSSPASLLNTGLVNSNVLNLGNASLLTLHGGDIINNQITLTGGSMLTVQQTNGTGLTFNGASVGALSIDPSQMDLIFSLNTAPNWDFRWADPSGGGNWIGTIDSLIASGQIVITAPQGYWIIDQGGYTSVEGNYSSVAVPEPSALVLMYLGVAGAMLGLKWRLRKKVG